MELIGPYLGACLLLVVAGSAKAWRPDDTARALTSLLVRPGLRTARGAVRIGAGVEALLGAFALVVPRPPLAVAVAASYAGFAVFVAYARRLGGALASCGCFGTPDTPATRLHIMIDLALAGSAASVAAGATGSTLLTGILAHQPLDGVPLVFVSAVCVWLMFHALSTLPRALAAVRLVAPRES